MLLILESFSSTGKILDYAATQSKGVISEKKLDDMIFGAENHQELERRAHVIVRSYTSCLQLRRSTCGVPDEYLVHTRRPLLMGREVLKVTLAHWSEIREC